MSMATALMEYRNLAELWVQFFEMAPTTEEDATACRSALEYGAKHIAIIDAMNHVERAEPCRALEPDRLHRIAQIAGATHKEVAAFVSWWLTREIWKSDFTPITRILQAPAHALRTRYARQTRIWPNELCVKTHEGLIVGRCPYCGQDIMHGEVTD